ncbi:MAG: YitT family protein [Planococcus donghaensis]
MRYGFYMVGILLLTLGIACTIQSDLGTSPFDAVLVGLATNVGLTVGSWEVIVALLLIGCNSFLIRQKPEVLGLVTAIITGIGIDLWLFVLSNLLTIESVQGQTIYFAVGLLLIGVGTATYLHTNFAPIPIDRLTLILRDITKTNLFVGRTLIYTLFLIFALLLGGPIGIGTILTVCFAGLLLNFFMPPIAKAIDRVIIPPVTTTQ